MDVTVATNDGTDVTTDASTVAADVKTDSTPDGAHATTDATPHSADVTTDRTDVMTLVSTGNVSIDAAGEFYEVLISGFISAHEVSESDVLIRITEHIEKYKESLKTSRTSALWMQYMDMIDLLKKFIKAERTGNWRLHLEALSEMLPYLAASGHNNYTKSVWMYLQEMSNLQVDHPEVYQHFENGLHIVRRSDRLWAGLSSDLIIEQELMRSLKISGGLTRGRGMTEEQRQLWVLSMPASAEVNRATQCISKVTYNSGEQNKDMSKARQERDMQDIRKHLCFFEDRNPLHARVSLRNIATGVTADKSVNVDLAKNIGQEILNPMDGNVVADYSFKRNKQAVTLNVKSSIKIDGEKTQVQ